MLIPSECPTEDGRQKDDDEAVRKVRNPGITRLERSFESPAGVSFTGPVGHRKTYRKTIMMIKLTEDTAVVRPWDFPTFFARNTSF